MVHLLNFRPTGVSIEHRVVLCSDMSGRLYLHLLLLLLFLLLLLLSSLTLLRPAGVGTVVVLLSG